MSQLLSIIDRLPRHSHYVGELYDDDDLAPYLAEMPTKKHFGLTGWSSEIELLTSISGLLEAILSRTIAGQSKNGKGPKVTPSPRPRTAIDRLEQKNLERQHESIVSQLIPKK